MIPRFLLATLFITASLLSQERHDVFVRVGAIDSLDATYFVPDQIAPPPAGFPVIIMVGGFGLGKESNIYSCQIYANLGYITFAYSVRGQGKSSGTTMIMSTQERNDLAVVLNYIRNLPHVDTASIGLVGGSQGGLHGLWAAIDRLPLRAISADAITPDWASEMLVNGCIRRTLILLLQSPTVRYNAFRDTLWDLVRRDSYDSLKLLFARDRDVDTARLNRASIPMLRLLKWQDHYFTAGGGISSFLSYGGMKKLYLGTQGHFSDELESEQQYQYKLVTQWLDTFLRKSSTGIPREAPIAYSYTSLPVDSSGAFTWRRDTSSTWPPPGIRPMRFYLHTDSTLTDRPPAVGKKASATIINQYRDPSYTFSLGYIEGFHGKRFDAIIPKTTIAFTSPRLTADVLWAGAPHARYYVTSPDQVFPIHAQVYEVDTLGVKHFINRIDFTARHWRKGFSGWIDVDGAAHAHQFRAGGRIRIELTNIDRTDHPIVRESPFVVPLFRNARVTIDFDARHSSFIDLPLMQKSNDSLFKQ